MISDYKEQKICEKDVIKKYSNLTLPYYVEYPHKSCWHKASGDQKYLYYLNKLISQNSPVLFYVHIPYCPKMCYFCSCHTKVATKYELVIDYMYSLTREIELFEKFLGQKDIKLNIREMHFGGGSPTILKLQDFSLLCKKLSKIVDISLLDEFAMEIDPRNANIEKLAFYRDLGVTRISFGVQDFDPEVQRAVGRIQPFDMLEILMSSEIKSWFKGINFDIMWGLPKQTLHSFSNTIEKTIKLSPDRVSLLSFDYSPMLKKHQLLMNPDEFPHPNEKMLMFDNAVKMLSESGYIRIGYDHFTKPDDAISVAYKEKKVCWNPLGYTAGRYQDIIGFGTNSASRLTERYYSQKVYDENEYTRMVLQGNFPILREYDLQDDDILRREVIHNLRAYGEIDFYDFYKKQGFSFIEYFKDEIETIKNFIEDDLVFLDNSSLKLSEIGQLFTPVICQIFDKHYKGRPKS